MTTETATFTCSICGERSTEICVYCTKDSCHNHRCERCKRCSDCCECEIPLSADEPEIVPEERAAPLGAPTDELVRDESAPFKTPAPDQPQVEHLREPEL